MHTGDFAALIELMEGGIPFHRFLGLKVESLSFGHVVLRLPFREEFLGDVRRPALHGGIISTLIDTAGGLAAWSHFSIQDKLATVDMRVDYLLPGPKDDIMAEARVRRLGNRMAVTHTLLTPAGDREAIIAEGRAVYNIRRATPTG